MFAAEQYDVPRVHLAAEVVNPRPAGEAERVYVDVARRQTGHDRCHFAYPFFRLRGSEVLNAIPWFEAQMAAERTIVSDAERDQVSLGGQNTGRDNSNHIVQTQREATF